MKKLLLLSMIILSTTFSLAFAAEAPKGHLVIAVPTLGGELWDPRASGPSMWSAGLAIYNSILTLSDDTGEIVAGQGGIAKSHYYSKDRKTYTIEMEKGIQFHDGWGEMTAEDVKYGIELLMSEASKSNAAGVLRKTIDSMEIVNSHKLVFHFKEPAWAFTDNLHDVVPQVLIGSKKYIESVGLEKAGRHPIGAGPFKFKEHVFGEKITVEAVENHWFQTPRLKSITWRKVPEAAVRLLMVKTDEAHVTNIVYDQIKEVQEAGLNVKAMIGVNQVTIHFMGMFMNPKYDAKNTPAWAKGKWWEVDSPAHKVRKALSLAIDRKSIVEYGLYGFGSLEGAAVSGFFPSQIGYDPEKKIASYNPDKALQLLREAGYANPADLEVVVDLTAHSNRPYNKPMMEAVAGMWEKLGITVKTELQSDYANMLGLMKERVLYSAWCFATPLVPNPVNTLGYLAGEDGPYNMYGEAPELTRLLREKPKTEEEVIANAKALNDLIYKLDLAASAASSANLYATSANMVWPSKPGPGGIGYHNYDEMYFKD